MKDLIKTLIRKINTDTSFRIIGIRTDNGNTKFTIEIWGWTSNYSSIHTRVKWEN
jgi:hypothetical protein